MAHLLSVGSLIYRPGIDSRSEKFSDGEVFGRRIYLRLGGDEEKGRLSCWDI